MAATQAQCESGSFGGGTTALAQMCGEGKNRISRRLRRVRRNLQFAPARVHVPYKAKIFVLLVYLACTAL